MKNILIALTVFFLAGCMSKPPVFDIPQKTWRKLPPSEQQQVIQNYINNHQQINYQNCYYKHCWNN